MFLNLANGREELKTFITKERKKKTRKPIGILNMGRSFRGPIKWAQDCDILSNKDENWGEDDKSVKSEKGSNLGYGKYSNEDKEDYSEEQYPPADEKYKQLEDCLNAMEIQRVLGLDFEELILVSGFVIPHKFKVPTFANYDGVSCPKLHLRFYVRQIQPHTADRKLWVHFFQESLSGSQLE